MRMKFLFLLASLFFSSTAFAWVIHADFEDGNTGAKADGEDGFSGGAFKTTTYSTEKARSGKQSAKTTITQGTTGFSEFGGQWIFPSKLREGEEMWYRAWVYFPSGFDFSCSGCSEGIKFMRVATKSSSGEHQGYQNYFVSSNAMIIATSVNSKDFYGRWPVNEIRGIGDQISTGTWHAYEQYIKFSGVPGKGIMRTWQDGKLIFEDTETATLRSTSSTADFAWIFSYWNNNAPKTQSAFIDDIVITNERPDNLDSKGNPYIGVGDTKFTSPPNPPRLN